MSIFAPNTPFQKPGEGAPIFSAADRGRITPNMVREARHVARSIPEIRAALSSGDPAAVIEAYSIAASKDPTIPADVLLPVLFTIGGDPYTLADHWMYAPLFRIFKRPKITTLRAARQTGKTQNISGQDTLKCSLVPNYKQINVTPLYEMARRWSANYIKPLMDGCNIPGLVAEVGRNRFNDSVLQRSFPNGSTMMFTFAYLDCERTRGIAGDEMAIDEVQSMQMGFIDIIREVLSGSLLGFERYSGTPKTMDNPIEKKLWKNSSMAHWMVWCDACNKDNIFSEDFDMRANIGKDGPVCRYCGKPINCRPRPARNGKPASGYYVHKYPERAWEHVGYHIPQCVHPRHTDISHKWKTLVRKMEQMKEAQFDNECLAISSDVGAKLVTTEQLRGCAQRKAMTLDRIRAERQSGKWRVLVTATDWSGKGRRKNAKRVSEDTELEYASYTAQAIVGIQHGKSIPEVIYVNRLPYDTDYVKEAQMSVQTYIASGSDIYAHDFTGAGSVKEVLAKQYGIDQGMKMNSIMPFLYTSLGPEKPIVHFDNKVGSVQYYYSLDKHRALSLVALLIQRQELLMPEWNAPAPNGKEKIGNLLEDWLSLFEETSETPRGRKFVTIQRDPDRPDDVAQAITMGCCAIWHLIGWPPLAQYITDYLSWDQGLADEVDPDNPSWSDEMVVVTDD